MNRPEALKQIELAEPYAQDRVFTNFRGDGRSSDKSRSFTSVLIRPET